MTDYPRDLVGYAGRPPAADWPGGASVAVQFVLNYEEGSERSVLDGDATSETFLSEMVGVDAFGDRHMSMESLYEYGSRAGFWRVLRVFARRGLPITVFGVATALARNPAAARAVVDAGHEVAGHGLRWLSYQ
ncbi:MAG: polysaccharide deacetylase family protein, partial [Actinomycetota bacterium]|nr:polysaccharide deacetylase family protein [Actinomycetota bacterium]